MEREPKPFSEIEIGDEIGPVVRVPTTEVVKRYAKVTHLPREFRFFFDPEHAVQSGFERPVVPGPLNTTFLAQMLKDHFAGWQLRVLNTTFRAPVAHGDTLTLWGTVTEKTWREGMAAVHCDVVAENQQGERVIVGTAILSRREPKE